VISKAFLISVFIASAFAASPSIGIITASGHFTLDRSQVWGNSTLFDGATVETDAASSDLALRNGVRIQLGSASRATVYDQRVLIERGVGQVTAPQSYEVDAAGLKIRGASAGVRLRVALGNSVEVIALAGGVRVANGSGLLLAAIPAGGRMSFSMQGGTLMRTGCLMVDQEERHFAVQDENTQEVIEVIGPDLALNVGNIVEITGTASSTPRSVSIATSVLDVTSVAPRSQGGCLSVASALGLKAAMTGAGGTPGAPTPAAQPLPRAPKTGMSTGAKIAIAGAVVGGGVGGALAALGGKKSTSP